MEWSVDAEKNFPGAITPPPTRVVFPAVALNLSSHFPNDRKCGYIFTRIRFTLKPSLSYCISRPIQPVDPSPVKSTGDRVLSSFSYLRVCFK